MSQKSEFKRWAVIGAIVLFFANYGSIVDRFGPSIEYDEMNAGKVTLYSTSWCGYCRKARQLFERHDVPFVELDIEKSDQARLAYEKLGGQGVPVITIGNDVVYGFNQGKIRSLLRCEGCE